MYQPGKLSLCITAFVSGFALSNFFLGSWEVAKGQYFYCEAVLPLTL